MSLVKITTKHGETLIGAHLVEDVSIRLSDDKSLLSVKIGGRRETYEFATKDDADAAINKLVAASHSVVVVNQPQQATLMRR